MSTTVEHRENAPERKIKQGGEDRMEHLIRSLIEQHLTNKGMTGADAKWGRD